MDLSGSSLDVLASTALAGFIFTVSQAYRETAPTLTELRESAGSDFTLQRLVDADVTVGIPVLIAGIVASWLMKSWLPLAILGLAFLAMGGYHHSILSDQPRHP